MSAIEAPSRVARAAEVHELGDLIAASKGSNPLANAAFMLVVTSLLVGAVLVVGVLGWDALRRLAVFLLALSLLGLLYTLVSLLSGFRRFYVYTGGLVWWSNGRVTAVPWNEVAAITRNRMGQMRIGFHVARTSGRQLFVEAIGNSDDGRVFGEQLEEAATRAGLQVQG